MNRMSALLRVMRELTSCLCSQPCEDEGEVSTLKPGTEPSPEFNHTVILISNFPASRSLRNKRLWFISHPLYGTLLQQHKLTMTSSKPGMKKARGQHKKCAQGGKGAGSSPTRTGAGGLKLSLSDMRNLSEVLIRGMTYLIHF